LKRLFLLLLFGHFFFSTTTNAQETSPFEITLRRESLLLAGGVSVLAVGAYAYFHMNPSISDDLQRKNIFPMDRFAVDLSSEAMAVTSDITALLSIGLPFISMATSRKKEIVCQDMLMYIESICLIEGLTLLSKSVFKRPRPYAYRFDKSQNSRMNRSAISSFFSNHTAAAFNGAVFAGTVFQQRYPDSPWVKPIWIGGLILATATAIFRVTSGNHFPTDVLAGAVLGSFTGWLLPHIHRRGRSERGLSFMSGGSFSIGWRF